MDVLLTRDLLSHLPVLTLHFYQVLVLDRAVVAHGGG